MYTLYNDPLGYNSGHISLPKFNYILNAQEGNLKKTISYYRNANFATKSDHLLVRLLQSLPSGRGIPIMHYRYMIEDLVDELAQTLSLTSSTSYGKAIKPGVFLGDDSEEVIILTTENFSTSNLQNTWDDLEPIRFLKHPKSDLGLRIPLGEGYSDEVGPSVILINLPMLACQYKLWRESIEDMEYQETVMQFLVKYPIANSLNSYQQVVFTNILYKLFNGERIDDIDDNHPFYLNRYYDKTIEGLSDLLHYHLDKKQSFGEFLEGTTLLNDKSLREVIAIPKMALTRQVVWGLTIARLELISMLLTWDERVGGGYNRKEIIQVKRSLRRLTSDKTMYGAVSRNLKDYLVDFIREEIASYF